MMAPANTINKLAPRHRNNLHFSCITDMGSGMKNHGQTVGNKIDYHAIILPNLCTEAMTNTYSPFFPSQQPDFQYLLSVKVLDLYCMYLHSLYKV